MTNHTRRSLGILRVFLVAQESLAQRALLMLSEQESDLEVCGVAPDPLSALPQMLELEPDIAVVDLALKEGEGLALIRVLRQKLPAMKILVLSLHDQPSIWQACLDAGAEGYLIKTEAAAHFLEALRTVGAGQAYVPQMPSRAQSFAQDYSI